MPTAVKISKNKYCCRVYDKYKKKQVAFYADTAREAERKANMYKYSIQDKPNSMTFGEAYDMYLQAHPEWGDKTRNERRKWKDQKYSELLDKDLDDLTDEYLQVWLDRTFAGLSGKTVANQFTPVIGCIKRYRPHRTILVTLPRISKPKLNLPTEATVVRLMEAVEGTEFCVPVYLAAFACMRRGEVAALDLAHVDFDRREIHIEFAKAVSDTVEGKSTWKLKSPKNGEPRKIIVPQVVIDKIRQYGLPSIDNPDVFSADFGDFLETNDFEHCRFHDLRHYCAARMLSSTPAIPISVVQKYGGWKNKQVLLEIYDYVIQEVNEASMATWNEQATMISQKLVCKQKEGPEIKASQVELAGIERNTLNIEETLKNVDSATFLEFTRLFGNFVEQYIAQKNNILH